MAGITIHTDLDYFNNNDGHKLSAINFSSNDFTDGNPDHYIIPVTADQLTFSLFWKLQDEYGIFPTHKNAAGEWVNELDKIVWVKKENIFILPLTEKLSTTTVEILEEDLKHIANISEFIEPAIDIHNHTKQDLAVLLKRKQKDRTSTNDTSRHGRTSALPETEDTPTTTPEVVTQEELDEEFIPPVTNNPTTELRKILERNNTIRQVLGTNPSAQAIKDTAAIYNITPQEVTNICNNS